MDPFTNNSNSTKTAYLIETPLTIQLPIELTQEPVTLGEHLRRRRVELGLKQKDVATQLGVTASTIWNWENGWSSITLSCIPKVIAFLGYNPIPCPEGLMERLAWYKEVNGLSLERLGAEMGRDPEQLADWLFGRRKPCRKNLEKIGHFLSDHVHGPDAGQLTGTAVSEESALTRATMKSLMTRRIFRKVLRNG